MNKQLNEDVVEDRYNKQLGSLNEHKDVEIGENEILEYAIFGMDTKISYLEKEMRKGIQLLKDRAKGLKDNCPCDDEEIEVRIKELKSKIAVMDEKIKHLNWNLAMIKNEG